ncbi:MAG: FlgD immunoglobulin-like domain containing protein [bacterium]
MKERILTGGWPAAVGLTALLLVFSGPLLAEGTGKTATVSMGEQLPLRAEGRVELPVVVNTSEPIAGVQIRASYDAALMTPGTPRLTERSAEMTVAFNDQDGELTVIVYSALGEVIPAGEGPVLAIPFKVEDFGLWTSDLGLDFEEVILASPAAEALPVTVKPGSVSIGKPVPTRYNLAQNYPNPFNPETSIQYSVVSDQSPPHITLKIYNILGEEVRTLVDELKDAGYYTVTWDGKDSGGLGVASGVYFYRLTAGDFTSTKRMVLLK